MSPHAIAPARPLAEPAVFDPDPPAGVRVSEADYWAYYYEHENGYEWNNGILEVKPVSDTLTIMIHQWLLALLRFYLGTHHNARITGLEMGFRLIVPGKVAIRKPDLGLVLNDNAVPLKDLDRSYKGIFDLCVEALSDSNPSEIARDTVQKRREYEAAGVREYYILHYEPSLQLFYQRNAKGRYEPMPIEDGILRSGTVPGFQFRIADLVSQPEPEQMIEDPVYAPFVLPRWQQDRAAWTLDRQALAAEREALAAERVAREQAERLAQQERAQKEWERAEKERERMEKETLVAELAKLRRAS